MPAFDPSGHAIRPFDLIRVWGLRWGARPRSHYSSVPVLVLLSYVIGPKPMDLQFWPGAVVMVFIATLIAAFITSSGRSAWFVGFLLIFVYAVFAIITLYLLPPQP
jgi:Ca2+:H+ antiporter